MNWLILNTRAAPFNDLRVRQALNYAIDRGKITRLLQTGGQPTCQMLTPVILGYRPYCPYTLNPSSSGMWTAPNLAKAERLIAATHTRGTPITIWNLGGYDTDYTSIEPYLTSLLDRLGYPTKIKDLHNDFPQAPARFADSRTRPKRPLAPAIPRTRPPPRSSRPTSPANPFTPTRRKTQTPRSSATPNSTRKSTARSQPKATTRPTRRHSGPRPTRPPPTKRQLSPSISRATLTSSPRASATTNTASRQASGCCPTNSGCASSTRRPTLLSGLGEFHQ